MAAASGLADHGGAPALRRLIVLGELRRVFCGAEASFDRSTSSLGWTPTPVVSRVGPAITAMGKGSRMQVQEQAMAKGIQAVNSAASEIDRLSRQLDDQVQTLLSAWRGESQQAFGAVYTRWESEQRKLHIALQEMHDALDQTHTKVRVQEQERAGQFSHIAGML